MSLDSTYFKRSFKKPDGRQLHLYGLNPVAEEIVPTNPPHEPVTGLSELRWNPLRGEWVAYASHRQNRTFLPPKEYSPLAVTKSPEFPTELPAGDYDVAVFENLFPSLSLAAEGAHAPEQYVPTRSGLGSCEVVVFTQNPETSLGLLPLERVELVLKVLAERTTEMQKNKNLEYALAFENRGVEVGVTLHHPHGQIYTYPFVPPLVAKMAAQQSDFYLKQKKSLLLDMVEQEIKDGRRLLHDTRHVSSFIPVCARYPYETWIVPKRQVGFLSELTNLEIRAMASHLKSTLMKLDAMWSKPFPYLLSVFQAPLQELKDKSFQAHIQIFPALRTADKLKYLAGTELGAGMFVNDCLPEEKAGKLREVTIPFQLEDR